jgi:pimeloyl-ACP methyl ester carboxylesterase
MVDGAKHAGGLAQKARRQWRAGHALMLALLLPLSGFAMARARATGALPIADYLLPQRLVPVQGARRLNLFCIGHGSPTVLMDAGTGGGTRDWREVQGAIARLTTACAYDRAGYGFSDAPARASDAANAADDLHRLVHAAKLALPLVLVGHSNGGFYAVRYAWSYPQDVGGMVLVDPGFAGQMDFGRYGLATSKAEELRQANASLVAFAAHCLELSQRGVLTTPSSQRTSPCLDNPPHADPRLHRVLNALEMRPGFFEAYLSEFRSTFVKGPNGTVNDREVPLRTHELGNLPLIVLTASEHPAPVKDFTQADQEKYFNFWWQGHDRVAALSSRGENILVEPSGHFIQREHPRVVERYVDQVVDAVRHGRMRRHGS